MLHALSGEAGACVGGRSVSGWAVCGGHSSAYTAGRVFEGARALAGGTGGGRALTASTGPILRVASYDAETGTLYLETEASEDGAEADLTDDEMIVVCNGVGQVVSVTVPFVDTHWSRNWSEFLMVLLRLGRIDEGELARAIGRVSENPPRVPSYRVALSSSPGQYRVAMSSGPRSRPYASAQVARNVT